MGHTDEEIERAASRFEALADALDPATVVAETLGDLQAVAVAADAVHSAESTLRERVLAARSRGRSWNQIAVALGVSRQAARQRFAERDLATSQGAGRTEQAGTQTEDPRTEMTMTGKKNVHTVPTDSGWANRREGGKQASSTHATKAEAQAAGRAAAKRDGVEHLIHKKDGTIGDRNSYGNDPHPPKG